MGIICRTAWKLYTIFRVKIIILISKQIQVGKNLSFRKGFVLNASKLACVRIGQNVFFGNHCSINAHEKVTIGNDCVFGEGVKIYDHNCNINIANREVSEQGYSNKPVSIGEKCWIGNNVVILMGSEIGSNVVISAGSIIKGYIEPNMIVRNNCHYDIEPIQFRMRETIMEKFELYPTLSIIMPVYNSEKYVKRAIQSVLKQTYENFELILIDDGSTDKSGEICDEMAKADIRIIVIHKENGGICAARNDGIKISRGKYLTFIDNDDEYDERFCEVLFNCIEKDDVDIVKCGRRNTKIKPDGTIIGITYGCCSRTERIDSDAFLNDYYQYKKTGIFSSVWNGLFRKDIIERYHIAFDERFRHGNEDIFFNIVYLSKCSNIAITEEILYTHYYRLDHSTSMKYYDDQIQTRIEVIHAELELICERSEQCSFVLLDGIRDCFRILVSAKDRKTRSTQVKVLKEQLDFNVFNRFNYIYNSALNKAAKADLFLIKHRAYSLYFLLRRTRLLLQ